MFVCRYCGYSTHDGSVNSCQNTDCIYYGRPMRMERNVLTDFRAPQQRQRTETEYITEKAKYYNCNMPEIPCNDKLSLGFATVPFQRYNGIMPLDKGLAAGTIFVELNMPYSVKVINRG